MTIIRGIKAQTQVTEAPKAKGPSPKIWANIGYETEVIDPNTGKPVFIGLPLGSGIDTMRPAEKRGRDENYHHVVDAKNELLEDLKSYALKNMKPGQEEIILDLKVQLRFVHEVEETDPAENPYRSTLAKMAFAQS